MLKITAKMDMTLAVRKIHAIGPRVKKTLMDHLRGAARGAAISCAKSTQPYGTGEAAKSAGENAVARDIKRIYATPGDAYGAIAAVNQRQATAFWKALDAGEFVKAQGILKSCQCILRGLPLAPFDPALHKAHRNGRTGLVNEKLQLTVVLDLPELTKYIEAEKALVGYGKAAWANAARKLGGIRGLRSEQADDINANWILRHKNAPGIPVENNSDPAKPYITITSEVAYADEILPEGDRREAVRIAKERLLKSLQIAMAYEAKQAMKETH